ncbi:glycoside hydrolase family 16 protein [Gelidibacter gilvus]|uniref:Glycoside hydrolase family 16 protein n=1 Tax=Gelidibacter gilvus TaxID=59602 RepID=A0A4Q0XIX0_9FLAO|nr:glycoside hydrolase family 16 protein [Gelidibacter gilvus]RXJ51440.1 glycoside hydrolase family 16 protein [Gelidibacter gilvus]
MKNLKYLYVFLMTAAIMMVGCQDDDITIGEIKAPTNLEVVSEIVGVDTENPFGDGSGVVKFTAKANNALSYKFVTPGSQQISQTGIASIPFTSANSGIFTYEVAVVAYGTGGISTTTTIKVDVFVDYSPPAELLELLYGDGSKTWRIKSEQAGHFGLGPVGGNIPVEWYGAGPEEKAGAGMYDDRYVFNKDGTFTHLTNGTVFGRRILVDELGGPGGGTVQEDDVFNYPYDDYTQNWQISAPGGSETITLSGIGFMGYYTGGSHQYRIFNRSVPNEMILTTVDGNGDFSWWFIITSEEPKVDDEFSTIYKDLIWEDTFDVDGAPDPAKWTYDLGTGDNGWGNSESQTYTKSPDNVKIEDGILKITAKAENGGYTSSRIKTDGIFAFTYGRVEVRAKLPSGGGTWPAIWMLGQNYTTVSWPASGEIDIMEHVGNDQNTIHSTLHYPGNSGGNGVGKQTTVPTASTEFHNYSVEWTPEFIKFLVDDKVFHTFPNSADTPFNADFFLILNVAMGGNFGGAIDPGFTASTLEIDYVKVYQ